MQPTAGTPLEEAAGSNSGNGYPQLPKPGPQRTIPVERITKTQVASCLRVGHCGQHRQAGRERESTLEDTCHR